MFMKRTCGRIDDHLWAYAANRLHDGERERVEAHLRRCNRCRLRAAETRTTVALMADLRESAAPPSMAGWVDLHRRLELSGAFESAQQRRSSRSYGYALVAAASLLIVASLVRNSGGRSDHLFNPPFTPGESSMQPGVTTPINPITVAAGVTKHHSENASSRSDIRHTMELRLARRQNEPDAATVPVAARYSRRRTDEATPRLVSTSTRIHSAPLGVDGDDRQPQRNLVLTGVPTGDEPQRATNYVMGSVPAPQAVSAQEGSGRSQTL